MCMCACVCVCEIDQRRFNIIINSICISSPVKENRNLM